MRRLTLGDSTFTDRHCESDDERRALRAAKRRVKTRKHGGDDLYSWAVFVDGRPVATGESRSAAESIRNGRLREIVERATAARSDDPLAGFSSVAARDRAWGRD